MHLRVTFCLLFLQSLPEHLAVILQFIQESCHQLVVGFPVHNR
jgi:hypothetical protein